MSKQKKTKPSCENSCEIVLIDIPTGEYAGEKSDKKKIKINGFVEDKCENQATY